MSEAERIGQVTIKLHAQTEEYSVESSLQGDQINILFFIFMIDKLMADCVESKKALVILANAMSVMLGGGKGYEQISNAYNRFRLVQSLESYDYGLECKFLSKTHETRGDHLYVLTSHRPIITGPNKMVLLSALYAMHLRNNLSSDSVGILNIALSLLFKEYGEGSALPGITTVTKAPTAVANRLVEASNKK
jgi:hypothetical protein